MRRLFILPLLAAVLIASTAPVAAQEPFRFASTQNGLFADAFWQSCTPDTPEPGLQTCSFVNVFAFDGTTRFREGAGQPTTSGSLACVFHGVVVITDAGEFVEELSNESGCDETLTTDEFTVAADLSSATLTTTIAVQGQVCDEFGCVPVGDPRDVAVDVTWTAVSPVVSFRDRQVSHSTVDGLKCTFLFSGSGERAEAVATGTVDGMALGDSVFAQISRGRQSFSEHCK